MSCTGRLRGVLSTKLIFFWGGGATRAGSCIAAGTRILLWDGPQLLEMLRADQRPCGPSSTEIMVMFVVHIVLGGRAVMAVTGMPPFFIPSPLHTHTHTIARQTGTMRFPGVKILVSWNVKQDRACSPPRGAFLQQRERQGWARVSGAGGGVLASPGPQTHSPCAAASVPGAQSSFKLQQFLCSRGYAMDNLDEAQRIHPS